MAECPLRKVVIIDVDIALEYFRQVFPSAAAAGRQDLADAAVEALDHVISLGMARWDDAVLDALFVTDPIEAVLARWLSLAGGAKAIGKFLAVIGQDLGDLTKETLKNDPISLFSPSESVFLT